MGTLTGMGWNKEKLGFAKKTIAGRVGAVRLVR